MSVKDQRRTLAVAASSTLSYNRGTTFTLIKSLLASAPSHNSAALNFQIPIDAQRAMGLSERTPAPLPDSASVPFAERPQVFIANLVGGFCMVEGRDTALQIQAQMSSGTAPKLVRQYTAQAEQMS
ncbi:hypothetical protein DL765_009482 [Monosporascus sp. GIB2]|nr:hypothetical protein DL765_009482 [Monosporascus sp. GIB2]